MVDFEVTDMGGGTAVDVGGGGGRGVEIVVGALEVDGIEVAPPSHTLLPHVWPLLHALHKAPTSHWMVGKLQHTESDV